MYNKNPTLSLIKLRVGLHKSKIIRNKPRGCITPTAVLFLYRLQESADH